MKQNHSVRRAPAKRVASIYEGTSRIGWVIACDRSGFEAFLNKTSLGLYPTQSAATDAIMEKLHDSPFPIGVVAMVPANAE
jgi:hypothetical protein